MALERADFERSVRERKQAQVRGRHRELEQLAQAEVPIEVVTRSAEWDFFLSLLQHEIDQLSSLMAVLQESYAREPSFSHEDMSRRKAQMMQVAAQRDTLLHVIALPKEILEKGQKAKLALRDYSE